MRTVVRRSCGQTFTGLGVFCWLLLSGLILSSCTSPRPLTADERTMSVEKEIQNNDLLALFRQSHELKRATSPNLTDDISDHVTRYVKSCCEMRDQAVKLLRDNGFTVNVGERYDPKHPGTHGVYDEKLFGERSGGNFLYASKTYRAVLYVKNGRVDSVAAFTFYGSL